MTRPKVSFGVAGLARFERSVSKGLLDTLDKYQVKEIDTAFVYPKSEEVLGELEAAKRFTISTKAPGFSNGALAKQSVLDAVEKSLKELKTDSVDIYYLHSPDESVPIEETLEAIREIYAAGKFKRFGLSNFTPSSVQKIYDIQKAANSVLPSVFQGNYNAVARHLEKDMFPLLRKLNIVFYAYSPIAGGFLVKSATEIRDGTLEGGRFQPGHASSDLYRGLYAKESLLRALDDWETIAKDAKVSKAALAYRWIAYHSELNFGHGDAIIVGASKVSQLEESLTAILEEGPLSEEIAKRIDAIWKDVVHEAPVDNYHSFFKKSFA